MIWSSVQLPMPVPLSGVMFGERQVPNFSGISRPPAPVFARSGPVGPIAVWQTMHAPAFTRYAPRSTSFGSSAGVGCRGIRCHGRRRRWRRFLRLFRFSSRSQLPALRPLPGRADFS